MSLSRKRQVMKVRLAESASYGPSRGAPAPLGPKATHDKDYDPAKDPNNADFLELCAKYRVPPERKNYLLAHKTDKQLDILIDMTLYGSATERVAAYKTLDLTPTPEDVLKAKQEQEEKQRKKELLLTAATGIAVGAAVKNKLSQNQHPAPKKKKPAAAHTSGAAPRRRPQSPVIN